MVECALGFNFQRILQKDQYHFRALLKYKTDEWRAVMALGSFDQRGFWTDNRSVGRICRFQLVHFAGISLLLGYVGSVLRLYNQSQPPGMLAVLPPTLSFGNVSVGESSRRPVVCRCAAVTI